MITDAADTAMPTDHNEDDDDNPWGRGNNGPPKVLPFRAASAEVQDAASVMILWAFEVRLDGFDGGELPADVTDACRVIGKWLERDDDEGGDDEDDPVGPSPAQLVDA
jgi:hypothetical protein